MQSKSRGERSCSGGEGGLGFLSMGNEYEVWWKGAFEVGKRASEFHIFLGKVKEESDGDSIKKYICWLVCLVMQEKFKEQDVRFKNGNGAAPVLFLAYF